MKFGIFHELATPRPFTPEVESEVVRNALEQGQRTAAARPARRPKKLASPRERPLE
jgi:hypothetical protein